MKSREWTDGVPRIPLSSCPHCGAKMDAVSYLSGPAPAPEPGDVSVCFGCGEVLRFDKRLRLRAITLSQLVNLEPSLANEVKEVQAHIRAFLAHET